MKKRIIMIFVLAFLFVVFGCGHKIDETSEKGLFNLDANKTIRYEVYNVTKPGEFTYEKKYDATIYSIGNVKGSKYTELQMKVVSNGKEDYYEWFDDKYYELTKIENMYYGTEDIGENFIKDFYELEEKILNLEDYEYNYNETTGWYDGKITIDEYEHYGIHFKIKDRHLTYIEYYPRMTRIAVTISDIGTTNVEFPDYRIVKELPKDSMLSEEEWNKLFFENNNVNYTLKTEIFVGGLYSSSTQKYNVTFDKNEEIESLCVETISGDEKAYYHYRDKKTYVIVFDSYENKWFGFNFDNYYSLFNDFLVENKELVSYDKYEYKDDECYHASIPYNDYICDVTIKIKNKKLNQIITSVQGAKTVVTVSDYDKTVIDLPNYEIPFSEKEMGKDISQEEWNFIMNRPDLNVIIHDCLYEGNEYDSSKMQSTRMLRVSTQMLGVNKVGTQKACYNDGNYITYYYYDGNDYYQMYKGYSVEVYKCKGSLFTLGNYFELLYDYNEFHYDKDNDLYIREYSIDGHNKTIIKVSLADYKVSSITINANGYYRDIRFGYSDDDYEVNVPDKFNENSIMNKNLVYDRTNIDKWNEAINKPLTNYTLRVAISDSSSNIRHYTYKVDYTLDENNNYKTFEASCYEEFGAFKRYKLVDGKMHQYYENDNGEEVDIITNDDILLFTKLADLLSINDFSLYYYEDSFFSSGDYIVRTNDVVFIVTFRDGKLYGINILEPNNYLHKTILFESIGETVVIDTID